MVLNRPNPAPLLQFPALFPALFCDACLPNDAQFLLATPRTCTPCTPPIGTLVNDRNTCAACLILMASGIDLLKILALRWAPDVETGFSPLTRLQLGMTDNTRAHAFWRWENLVQTQIC
jgi:hypothetical protein